MIKIENVSVTFDKKVVMDDFTLDLAEKGIICFHGASGCGKSTLLRVITRLQKPDAGRVEGIKPGEAAIMFQEDRLLPWNTAAENIKYVNSQADTSYYMKLVGLGDEENTYPHQLSGGMKRRVALARTLAYDGKFIFMDEPFKGLDMEMRKQIYPAIKEIAKRKLVFIITHEDWDIEVLADQVYYVTGIPLTIMNVEKPKRP